MNEPNNASLKHPLQAFPIPLQQFEAAIQADPRVIGVPYTGSLGRGTADRFSDLDIELWVTDAAYTENLTTTREILGYIGAVQFLYSRETGHYTAFLGVEWQPIDLALHQQTEEIPLPPATQARIIKDTTHHLERMLASAQAEKVEVSWEQVRVKIEDAIDSFI